MPASEFVVIAALEMFLSLHPFLAIACKVKLLALALVFNGVFKVILHLCDLHSKITHTAHLGFHGPGQSMNFLLFCSKKGCE